MLESIYEEYQNLCEIEPHELARLDDQRKLIVAHLKKDERESFHTVEGKLAFLSRLMAEGTYHADQVHELQCMGVIFGDAFAEALGLEWVVIEDQYGRDAALQIPGKLVFLFPLTLISKKLEDGLEADIHRIFEEMSADIRTVQSEDDEE